MFVALAGNFFLSQNSPIPIPKKTIKLEVIKSIPLNQAEPIREINRQRIKSFDAITPDKLPKIQKPLEKLENTNIRPETPMIEQRKQNPIQSSLVAKRKVIEKTLDPIRPVRKDSILPRNAPRSQITKSLPSSRMTETKDRATRINVPKPKKRILQPINQPTLAKNSGFKKGNSLIETSSFRALIPHFAPVNPGKIEDVQSSDAKETLKPEQFPPITKHLASLEDKPRSVPDVYEMDPILLQGYSSEIQRKISAKIKYPKRAKRKGRQGQMTVRFKVLKSGEIQDLILVTKSPFKELNRAGLKAVRQAAPFPSLPEGMEKDFLVLELPIRFEIK
jgi:TonB family protein